MSTTFVPHADRILVRPIEGPKTTASGLITLPDSMKQETMQGEVLAVGCLCSPFSVGDKVVFGKYAGWPVTINGEKLLVMKFDEVMGQLKAEAN